MANTFIKTQFPKKFYGVKVVRFSGTESVSCPFEYSLELVCVDTEERRATEPVAVADALQEQEVAIGVELADGGRRWFHGLVTYSVVDYANRTVSLTIQPALALLDERSDSRVFDNASLKSIIATLLDPLGIEFEWRVSRTIQYESKIQYNETDLNFFHRLVGGGRNSVLVQPC